MLLEARALGSLDLQAKAMLYLADISIADDPPRAMRGYWSAAELHAHGGNRYGEYQALVSAAFAELLYGDVMRAAAVLRSVLERWPGLLRDTALFCVLQGAVILLVEGERFVSAATLSGAIPADTPMIVFTFDENAIARFDATARVLADVLGDANLAALRDCGRRMHRDEIFAAALAALRAVESAAG
jgi:hypothetical protein